MKTLRRTLALFLSAAFTISALAVGASANYSAYTDASSVGSAYAEAVDLLTGLNIVSGATSTTIDPKGNYTREQAAQIICYMTLGQAAADALKCSSVPFTDVPADRWSSGFIAYCVSQGIISGNGDGTFDPTGELTGYSWAKMLLCSLSYGKSGEYTGRSWEFAVAKDAVSLDIFKKDAAAATGSAITREQAILLAFNTLFISTVEPQYNNDNRKEYVTAYNYSNKSIAYLVYGFAGLNTSDANVGKGINGTDYAATATTLGKYYRTQNGVRGYSWYYKSTTTPCTGFYTD